MKKVFQILAIVLLFGAVSSTSSHAASTNAAKGFYSIEDNKYYSISQFKTLSRSQKVSILNGEYYLIASGSVFPIAALLLSDDEFLKSRIDEAKFKKDNSVQIDSEGNITPGEGPIEEYFSVLSID